MLFKHQTLGHGKHFEFFLKSNYNSYLLFSKFYIHTYTLKTMANYKNTSFSFTNQQCHKIDHTSISQLGHRLSYGMKNPKEYQNQ